MNSIIPGTTIKIGKWYHATQIPPKLTDSKGREKYSLLLGIKDLGIIPGHYSEIRKAYEWDCQRYEGTPRLGWMSRDDINNNLEWVLEPARGVSCWMVIPEFDNKIASIDGLTGFNPQQDEQDSVKNVNLAIESNEKGLSQPDDEQQLRFHLN